MFEFKLRKRINEKIQIEAEFEAKTGEITTIIGKSGAGKSSILNLIAGLINIDTGFVRCAEKDYTATPVHKRRFGYVQQQSYLFPHLNVLENLVYSGDNSDLEKYIEIFELGAHLTKMPKQLSGGESQRVALVRTLMSKPQLLLIDEAFSALDLKLRYKLQAYLKTLTIPTVLITHDLAEAYELSDQVIVIENGKIIAKGNKEIISNYYDKLEIYPLTENMSEKIKLSTAVLVGGKSRRMNGENKSFIVFKNQTFLNRILAEINSFDETFISVKDEENYKDYFYPLVKDEIIDIGAMGGLYTSLKYCKNDYLFVCATDMPLIKKELIEFMLEFITPSYECFVIEAEGKVHPLCGIYKKSVISTIEKMIQENNYRLMDLLKKSKVKYIPLKYSCFDKSVVSNINTKAELIKLNKPAILCVSGLKNSGKTTLITKLITSFKEEGYKVGTIKHDGHDFEIDHEGTDSYKHARAGSNSTLIFSDSKFAFIKKQRIEKADLLLDYFHDMDLVIIEGMKNSTYPKIEVVHEKLVCDENYLIAIATSSNLFKHEKIKTINRNDVNAFVKLIKSEVLNQDEG